MKEVNTQVFSIRRLSFSRLRHNKTQTVLTLIALILTTTLLMAAATMGQGFLAYNRDYLATAEGNHHAILSDVTQEQVNILKNHMYIESLTLKEIVATVVLDKMNGSLINEEELIPGITPTVYIEGREPIEEDEISASPAFFQRVGVEPLVGGSVELSFRSQGIGKVETKTFTISGLQEQIDLSELDISDTRISYTAMVSKAFADNYLLDVERRYRTTIRVLGENEFNSAQLEQRVIETATNAGIEEDNIRLNDSYITWKTSPDFSSLTLVFIICLVIALFAGLIIYSIYYVSVITNIQELGKLKALGASRKQIKQLLIWEGMIQTAISVPIGLLLGGGAGYFIINSWINLQRTTKIHISLGDMVSFPVVLAVIVLVAVTVLFSLMRPMKMASRISPIDALRYQEQSNGKEGKRKGYEWLNLSKLSIANLSRNRKRTMTTISTLAMGGMLILILSSLFNSIDAMDYVRHVIRKGDFRMELRYSINDLEYPENNLDSIQGMKLLGEEMEQQILNIAGVEKVEREYSALAEIDHPAYKEQTVISSITRDDIQYMEHNVKQGQLDYDKMLSENGMLYPWDALLDDKGLSIGDTIKLNIIYGDKSIPYDGTIMASSYDGGSEFYIPEEKLTELMKEIDATSAIYIFVEDGSYDQVKAQLQAITDADVYFDLLCVDEELSIFHQQMNSIKEAGYIILFVLGIICFVNLVNTMITSIVTRRRELGVLQAIGMSSKQLGSMLWREGMVFTVGTLAISLTFGLSLGYIVASWAKNIALFGITAYHFPVIQTLILAAVLLLGQTAITLFSKQFIQKDTLVMRMRQ